MDSLNGRQQGIETFQPPERFRQIYPRSAKGLFRKTIPFLVGRETNTMHLGCNDVKLKRKHADPCFRPPDSPVGVDKMLCTFPRVKHSVITMINPIVPLITTPKIIACGRVFEESLISSAETRSSVCKVIGGSSTSRTHVYRTVESGKRRDDPTHANHDRYSDTAPSTVIVEC